MRGKINVTAGSRLLQFAAICEVVQALFAALHWLFRRFARTKAFLPDKRHDANLTMARSDACLRGTLDLVLKQ